MSTPITPPPALPASKRWWTVLRLSPVCSREVPMEAALSFPVPGEGVLHFFHSLVTPDRSKTRILMRMNVRLADMEVVEFRKAGEGGNLFPGLPDEVPGLPAPYDGPTQEAFFAVFPEIVRRYPAEPAGTLGPQFREALEALAGPVLMPYYRALNPHFFEWCG
jgi:hypothetical protein